MNVFTVPMKLMTAVVLDEVTEDVKRALLKLGVLDFINVSRLAPEQASRLATSAEKEDPASYADLRGRVETLFMQAALPTPATEKLDPDTMRTLDMDRSRQLVESIVNKVGQIREQQKQLSQARIRTEELLRYVAEKQLQYIDIRIGVLGKGSAEQIKSRLANQASVILQPDTWNDMILLTLKRDRQQIGPLMESLQWTENPDGTLQKKALVLLEENLRVQLQKLDAANVEIKNTITEKVREERENLEQLWCDLRLHELMGEITEHFSHTRNTTIFSGWVPQDTASELEQAILTASHDACVIEWIDARQMPREEIPVAVDDIPLLRPFQKLVDNYSVPEYGTINPTPFVAVSYLVMFALMFADAGQGLVILLLGLWGVRYYKKHPEVKPKLITADLSRLFIYLGGASIVSGIVFGSYFGYPWFEALWFDYHGAVIGHDGGGRDVYSILGITIWFGIVVIGTGLLLNWINLIRKKDYFHLLLDKNGLIGGWLFACGVYAAFAFVGSGYKTLPEGLFLPIAFSVPLVVLFSKVPLHRYLEKREGHLVPEKSVGAIILDSLLEWIVDVLEIFSGFLANTLSFMRVAGLGIAHVSLMSAFAQMSDLAGGTLAGILIIIAGNAMVIALEGLSAGIQALRLNYYEFFTKYFTGRGLLYNPVSLRAHAGRQILNRP
ncbi:V-type ATP synthase subunit I [Pleomorphochaeta sp. DL1XJH-081]|uniref:V-type ATP synthase subunit I n=1 Tax=Pleomorphochaeta sp. DL1XJH-081 TaxID=3409690 RepID=UPI003BB68C85